MKNKLLLLLFLIFSLSIHSYAQNNPPRELYFSGKIDDSKNQKLSVVFITYYINDSFPDTRSRIVSSVNIDDEGNFNFKLPDLGKPYFFGFNVIGTGLSGQYIVESSDDVRIQLTTGIKNTINFSGKGAEKYNLINKLNDQYWEQYHGIAMKKLNLTDFKDSVSLGAKLDQFTKLVIQFEKDKMDLIKNVGKLDLEVRDIIVREYARYYDDWQFRIMDVLYKKNINYQHQILNYYNIYKDYFFYEPVPISILCNRYMTRLAERIKFEVQLATNNSWVDLVSFYNALKNRYSGEIKERLVGNFVVKRSTLRYVAPFNSVTMDSLILDAKKTVTITYLQQAISDELRLQQGERLLPSTFIDLDGSKFNTESLKGKAVLIDVWFLGCSGCAKFHKAFVKDIYPSIKNNKNLIYLSINIDRKKENWLKGIESKLYTSPEYINVTTGSGLDHPFMKYYGISGGPYLMLVDAKGNIFSRLEVTQVFDHVNNFIELVNEVSNIRNTSHKTSSQRM